MFLSLPIAELPQNKLVVGQVHAFKRTTSFGGGTHSLKAVYLNYQLLMHFHVIVFF